MRTKLLLFLLIIGFSLSAQKWSKPKTGHNEFGFFRGYATYYGDLANSGAYINMADKGDALGMYLRFNANPWYSMRLSYTTGRLMGSDEDATDAYERTRNLSFENDIKEIALISEVNLMSYDMCYKSALYSPYIFMGIAAVIHNPVANLNGEYYDLMPMRTEGQNTFPYSGPASFGRWNDGGAGGYRGEYYLMQFAIPIGLGFKYRFYRNTTIAFELGFRKLFFDYIDDVSKTYVANPVGQGGDPTSAALANRTPTDDPNRPVEGDPRGTKKGNDFYTFLGISISFSSAKCGKRNPIKCFSFNKWN